MRWSSLYLPRWEAWTSKSYQNSLWACAKLKGVAPEVLKAVSEIVAQIPNIAKDMKAQGLSNSLWASAQLKDVAPEVLKAVPAIAAEIPNTAKDMIPQALSNCLWASGQLKHVAPCVLEAAPAIVAQILKEAKNMNAQDMSNNLLAVVQLKSEVPEVLEIVPAIVIEIPAKIDDMKPQDLSNSLEALVLLRDSVPEVAGFLSAGGNMDDIVASAAARLNALLPRLRGKDLTMAVPVTLWVCAKAEVNPCELLASIAQHLGSRKEMSALRDFNICALLWSYQVLDAQDEFTVFRKLLMSESKRRRLRGADVQSCELGRFRWNRA